MRWIPRVRGRRKSVGSWALHADAASGQSPVKLKATSLSNRRKRRLARQLLLDPTELGVSAPWHSRFLPGARNTGWIWVLQKNSGVPKRVRAIAATAPQRASLAALGCGAEHNAHFSWRGFELQGRNSRRLREVHALVSTRHAYVQPTPALQVRVVAVFARRNIANRELDKMMAKFPTDHWAVITYPVGEMLF